ncbi:hypothetical protein M011DRAFT_467107 [Sporormia fimetaria CBS 119925]|uniref:Stress response protein NST1 n=1 Tax=Sporormia fimetaria CBS 119925 TaxID=1340428 RepID=A0A6A6VBR0_9PLEO|nr:hypothetical protein M011DRAFT_467107 [Sporormia fimetaria CBS 119925]
MTEEQRMEEGRRMFQIFAARMFEQRVLQAYREKVANERQNMLLAEEEREREEERLAAAKKAEEAQKRREKRERQRQAKAEKEAQKAAEKAAKEAKAKAKQEELLEEQRKKKEEQRKKKEAERKALEEERKRKEAERLRRQQEEKERQAEAERKQRELKAQEKKAKEESRRKEREEREAKEKEIKERKAQEEKERREREAKAKADRERLRKEEQAAAAAKKPTVQPVGVALPPGLLKQTSSAGLPSPHVTPAVPKAPTPSRPRQSSQQGSHMSSPKTPHALPGSSNSVSPGSQNQPSAMPRAILTKPQASQHSIASHLHQPAHQMPPMGPPPGMHPPPGMTMPPGLNGFPGLQNPMPPGMTLPRHSISHAPGFPHQQPGPRWGGFPPAVHAPGPMPMSRGFSLDAPPGFSNMPPFSSLNQVNQMPGFDPRMATHSRQGSGSESFAPAPPTQPIQRPTPIQRPSSAKPDEDSKSGDSGIDEISDHLGSKALLDDVEDEPQPEPRRTSLQPGSLRTGSLGFGFHDAPPVPTRSDSYNSFHGPGSIPSVWGTPPMPFALSGPGGWGNSPTSGLFNNAPQWAPQQRPGEQRIVWIRRLLCDVCKSLRVQTDLDGFIDGGDVFEAVNSKRGASEMAINFQEIKEACDIIGDHSNGGGNLEYREPPSGSGQPPLSVRFVETTGPSPPALGEIGSPVPSHSALAGGNSFGRPFAGLGPPGL